MFDIIISDDASTDKTVDIINTFTKIHDNIKLKVQNSNLGVLIILLKHLIIVNAEYVFDIAGDDWLSDPYALQTLVDELDQNPSYSFVDSGFDCFP